MVNSVVLSKVLGLTQTCVEAGLPFSTDFKGDEIFLTVEAPKINTVFQYILTDGDYGIIDKIHDVVSQLPHL